MNVNNAPALPGLVASSVKARESAAAVILDRQDRRTQTYIINTLRSRGATSDAANRTAKQWQAAVAKQRRTTLKIVAMNVAKATLLDARARVAAIKSQADSPEAVQNADMKLQEIDEDTSWLSKLIEDKKAKLRQAKNDAVTIEKLLENTGS